MIDPHAHLRDWNQKKKDTVAHGLTVAWKAGLDAVFEMPNTDPPLIYRKNILDRIELADQAEIPISHGIYGGLTKDPSQVTEIVKTWRDFFPRVIGLKLYAGSSTGNLQVTLPSDQKKIISQLTLEGYNGVLAVHCEKESLFNKDKMDEQDPYSHSLVRIPESEVESIKDIISFTEQTNFKGTLHICHISTEKSVKEVENARKRGLIRITCGITPHHTLLYDTLLQEEDGYLLNMNPPLRRKKTQEKMLSLLLNEKIDWIETDHAPHRLCEKNFAKGIPVLPFYPYFIRYLKKLGMKDGQITNLTHNNICSVFNIPLKEKKRNPDFKLASEYEFDPFKNIKSLFL